MNKINIIKPITSNYIPAEAKAKKSINSKKIMLTSTRKRIYKEIRK